MKISNPKTGEVVENPDCHGCMCHDIAMVFGNLASGCCDECGCPKNLKGFEAFKAQLAAERRKD